MHNILITGSNGQLGSEIKELSSKYQYNFYFTDKEELDITKKEDITNLVQTNNINIIINCAAYTAVDKAQDDEKNASLINFQAVKNLSLISKEKNISLVHISTDYVFDGKNFKPYTEEDATSPNCVYGKTKLLGERTLVDISPRNSIIIRTSWLYSEFGDNFVKTMLKLGRTKDEISVVFDQVGTPTYAHDLAVVILEILPKIRSEKVEVYHFSNEGVLSWYDFAKEIMKMAKLPCKVNVASSSSFPRPAPRPHFSVLDKTKIKQAFGIEIPFWKDSLDLCLRRLGERN